MATPRSISGRCRAASINSVSIIIRSATTQLPSRVSTLLPMVERCVQRYPIRRVTRVADRGLLSIDQVEGL